MSGDLERRLTFPAIPIAAGEVCDVTDPAQAALWSMHLSRLWGEIRRLKEQCDDALRAELAQTGRTSMIVSGDLEVFEGPGKADYDGEALARALLDAGIDKDEVAAMFRPQLRDARELGKLERRNDMVAKAAEAARTRGRGGIKVRQKGQHAVAPRTPDSIRDHVADDRRAEAAARARGI